MRASHLILMACLCANPALTSHAAQATGGTPLGPGTNAGLQWEQRKFEEGLNLLHAKYGKQNGLKPVYAILDELSKSNPSSPYLYALGAELQYLSYNNTGEVSAQEVRAIAQRALQLKPDMPDPYVILAKVAAKEGEFVDAQTAADTALRLAPNKPEAMFAKAKASEAARDFAAAEKWYLKSIEAMPNAERKSNSHFWLGEMYLMKDPPDVPKALAAMKKAIELDPNHAGKRTDFARTLDRYTDRYDEAIEAATGALKVMDIYDARKMLAIALYAKWGTVYLRSGAAGVERQRILQPEAIAKRTGFSPAEMFAVSGWYQGGPKAAEALLKAGIVRDVDIVSPHECCTALLAAAEGGRPDFAKLLIGRGANVNAVDARDKRTALYEFAVRRNVAGVELLLSNGARTNVVDSYGTPLLQAAFLADDPDRLPITTRLLDAGADPSLPDRDGSNLLIVAARRQNSATLKMLLGRHRMDPNAMDAGGRTALTWAVNSVGPNSADSVRILLAAGASPWIKWGGADALEMVETYQAHQSAMFPAYREVATLLREARKSSPKPAGFPEWEPGPRAER